MPDAQRHHDSRRGYGITERQHLEIHCRREDVPALAAYLGEQRIFFSINHAFSSLTGRRDDLDFVLFEELFPALESRNGQLPAANNEAAARLVRQWRKAGIGGSDAHTLSSLGFTYTEVPAARDAAGFLDALRAGHAFAAGASGNYGKLTRAIAGIGSAFVKEQPWAILLAPLLLAIPAITLGNYLREMLFLHQASAIFSGSQLQMRFSK